MKNPKLSIITVNFNNNEGLKQTLSSIKQQNYTNYEHIIIDAGSTDNSLETILTYQKNNTHLTFWISEPDKGIYDGMNKGIKHANGEYLYFLNTGDCLKENVLEKIEFDGTKYIYGDVTVITANGNRYDKIYPDSIDPISILLSDTICHQACFIHNSLFKNTLYNTNYKIVADWGHIVDNIIFKKCNYKHVPFLIVDYDESGFSVMNGWQVVLEERHKWLKENVPYPFLDVLIRLDAVQSELQTLKESEIGSLLPQLNHTRKFQKRVKKIIVFLYRINSFFSHKSNQKQSAK